MSTQVKTKTITSEDDFTDWIEATNEKFRVSISGTWMATITVQCSFDGGSTPLDVESFTTNTEKVGSDPENGVLYRVGIKAGDFISGAADVRIQSI